MFASKDIFLKSSGGYQISRSVRLRSSASAYFNRTPASAGNRKTWTMSMWLKRGTLSTYQMPFSCFQSGGGALGWQLNTDNTFEFYQYYYGYQFRLVTTQVFRDPSAWYHFVFVIDTTQATSSNRIKVYVNGVQITAFSTATYPTQNTDLIFNYAQDHAIGQYASNNTNYFDGYLTEVNFIDGQALTPSSFGETNAVTGVWQPKKYAGTYGTNGFYLNFSDNSSNTATTIGKDYSGNGNNWTPNNISVTAGVTYDSMIDVPTLYADGTANGRGNYCVMNPLNPDTISLNGSLTNGNLNASGTTYGVSVFSCTFQVPQTGKWYWETVYTTITNAVIVGIRSYSTSSTDVRYFSNGNKDVGGSTTAYGSSWTTNDVIGVAVDRDAGTVTFYKNNTSQGSINIPTNSAQFDITFNTTSPFGSTAMSVNFGQRPFSYTPPTGFVALNTQNLPAPTISNGAQYMAATLWTGNGGTQDISNTVNGVGMQPDFVWIKNRSGANGHQLTDSVRGVTKYLFSDATLAEETRTTQVTAITSTGFSLGSAAAVNTSGNSFVGWQWKAGGTAVSNTSGTIISSVSANPTAGFSVVTYTGNGITSATVGHGLGVTPAMIIVKSRSTTTDWFVRHQSLAAGYQLRLNSTAAQEQVSSATTNGGLGSGTSSVINFISGSTNTSNVNASGGNFVAYCFAEVANYSKMGSYVGNGSTDGVFVYLGFKPRFVITKSYDATAGVGDWTIHDTSRRSYNTNDLRVFANDSAAESTSEAMDMLSNGFKIRATNSNCNTSGGGYIYMAFAENPFKNSLAR